MACQNNAARNALFLVVYTGFDEARLKMDKKPGDSILHNHGAVLNGKDQRLLNWITDLRGCRFMKTVFSSKVCILGNYGFRVILPRGSCFSTGAHFC